MPNPKPTPLTPEIIATHERLHPRLAALLRQIERVSGRVALQPVGLENLQLARGLMREAAKLLGVEMGSFGLRHAGAAAPPDQHALAVALGQTLARRFGSP